MYTIIAPHPDDEIIGCRQLILSNKEQVNNVIFLTNGCWSNYDFPEPSFAYQRRKESEGWLKTHCLNVKIHYLNIPDIMTYEYLVGFHYGYNLFYQEHKTSRIDFLINKIKNIAADDTIVCNNSDAHPTHKLSYILSSLLFKNFTSHNYIYYHIQHTFYPSKTQMPGLYEQTVVENENFGAYLYTVVLNPEEYEQKQKEFEIYYSSQYEDFQKSGLKFYPHEMYLSSNKLNLEVK